MRTETRGKPIVASVGSTAACGERDQTSLAEQDASPRVAVKQRLFPRFILFGILSIGGLVWDLWSKWAVFDWLKCPGEYTVWNGSFLGVPIDFQLATTFNLGALWGMGQGQTWLFATFSIIALGVIGYFLYTGQAVESWWLTIASALLLAGTLGNLYDRLGLHGWKNQQGSIYGVRDFLDFVFFNGGFHWATFNFADCYLVTGAMMLVLQSFTQPVPQPVKDSPSLSTCP